MKGPVNEAALRAIALPALRHRRILPFEGEAEGVDPGDRAAAFAR